MIAGKEVNHVGLCLFANNNVINHAENQMIDHNEKPTAVYLAGVMRKGENEVYTPVSFHTRHCVEVHCFIV